MTSDPGHNSLPELRASDADRDRVAGILRDAMAEGRLGMEEFEERLEETYKARTYAELEPLTRDLPVQTATDRAPAAEPAPGAWPGRIGGQATSTKGIGIMGGFQRKGRWTVPRRFTAFAFWGGGELDLRDADFEADVAEIRCITIMGGVNVVLPPDIELEVRGLGIMGGFDHAQTGFPGAPGAPRVVITGFAFWGGVGTSRKRRRADRLREKEQRRLERGD
ncbi:DUF1707 domain-containing protein [Streptomyces sp. A7024]|uniref:DUF1707 domain-containing protein n=1 Tax=Streptomyces coryli TaxID=1128680 RepID=A0A6G4U3R2_9ACTN|nr:DUF1707 domain-containing protein [Streptomyces coryli]NGN66804.1 DUF1707 domain-containing protein [Streptomyces coryli]